jgi:hypothetical protein
MKIPISVIAFLFMLLIASTFGCQVEARAGPELTSTPPPTSTETATVNLSPVPTPIKIPISISTPTPNGVEVTAMLTAKRCLQYKHIAVRWIEMEKEEKDEFHNLTLDEVPLVMAIMAAESGCEPHLTSNDGHSSIGLMQIIPRDWLPDVRTNGMNIYIGMYILDRSIDLADGDLRLALAYYNCGVPKVEANKCGKNGGVNYAEKVLNFWLPYFTKEN